MSLSTTALICIIIGGVLGLLLLVAVVLYFVYQDEIKAYMLARKAKAAAESGDPMEMAKALG